MDIDYGKTEQEFLKELEAGEFSIEVLKNNGPNRKEKEADDLAAFEAYMDSEDYQLFNKEVSEK
jgi:hypothetical protein